MYGDFGHLKVVFYRPKKKGLGPLRMEVLNPSPRRAPKKLSGFPPFWWNTPIL